MVYFKCVSKFIADNIILSCDICCLLYLTIIVVVFGSVQVAEPVYISVDNRGSDVWKLEQIIQLLKNGAVGVIPTDTVLVSYSYHDYLLL
jgi:hypothetical protein